MGGTLDNGIYLPDQGERNCYNGLKNNWDTLDNLIETVQALSSAGLTREIVNSLPTENIKTNVIYMLRNSQQSGDLYDEYMYINNAWEPIGTSATEMDNYYTKSETNALPAVASGITASKVTGYDSHVANTEVHVTTAEKTVWNGKQNALDVDQTAAVNSGVTGAKVTGYDTHVGDMDIHVTASDKTAWNAKQDGLSQAQLNAVNSGVNATKVTGYDTHVGDTSAHVSSSDRTAWNGKQDALTQTQLDNIAAVPDKANSADLATVATTGDYGDLLNAPTIPTVNNATLTIQKNGTDVATFTANASSNVTANLSIPTDTSDLTNGAGFLTQHNPIDNELSVSSENAVQNKVVTTALNGKAASSHTHAAGDINTGTFNIARIPNLDASKITSGTIDIARLPKGSLERLVKVADQTARYALTTDDVQLGDTVQQLDTGVMYVVTDETKLDSADGYTEFTAGSATSVPWSGVTGKPSTFTPSSHTHGNITNDGKVGTTANLPLITGTGGAIQAGSFGNQANTFCEGNDSRLSDARTPVAHTHGKADITDLFNSANTWTGDNAYSKPVAIERNTDTGSFLALKNSVAELGSTPASATPATIAYPDKNNDNLGYMGMFYDTDGSNRFRLYVRNKFTSGSPSTSGTTDYTTFQLKLNADQSKEGILRASFRPYDNNIYDLGSSSYQWNNLYAKKTNTDTVKAGTGTLTLQSNGTNNSIAIYNGTSATDGGGFWAYGKDHSNGSSCRIQIYNTSKSRYERVDLVNSQFLPGQSGEIDLGTSTNKWKTLNGINPGALSLPARDYVSSMDVDTTDWNTTGTTFYYTPNIDGWLQISVSPNNNYAYIAVEYATLRDNCENTTGRNAMLTVPVVANKRYDITIIGSTITLARLAPAQGNV